jgi:acyl-CoA synthetase (AMP-forming)/AMP-acid ligase II
LATRYTEVKLVDETKLGFSTKDKPPSGEICIRGMSVAQRYLDDDALTYVHSFIAAASSIAKRQGD